MTAERRRIGRYEVFRLDDGIFQLPTDAILGIAPPALDVPALPIPVNCFVISGPEGVTLVDAGTGSHWGPHLGRARDGLRALGFRPSEVRRVLITHLHGDHALGLLEEERAAFPWADILLPEGDFAHYTNATTREAAPENRRGGFDIAERLARAYGPRFKPLGPVSAIQPDIGMLALPGHTPGHSGYLVQGEGDPLLLFGDVVHLEDRQFADPGIALAYDFDPDLAIRTRRSILAHVADKGWRVAGGHLGGFRRIERAGEGFRAVTDGD